MDLDKSLNDLLIEFSMVSNTEDYLLEVSPELLNYIRSTHSSLLTKSYGVLYFKGMFLSVSTRLNSSYSINSK